MVQLLLMVQKSCSPPFGCIKPVVNNGISTTSLNCWTFNSTSQSKNHQIFKNPWTFQRVPNGSYIQGVFRNHPLGWKIGTQLLWTTDMKGSIASERFHVPQDLWLSLDICNKRGSYWMRSAMIWQAEFEWVVWEVSVLKKGWLGI